MKTVFSFLLLGLFTLFINISPIAYGANTTTITERKLLEYPAFGYTAGAALTALIKGIWDGLDLNVSSRFARGPVADGNDLELEHALYLADPNGLQCVGFTYVPDANDANVLYYTDIEDYTNYPITPGADANTTMKITNNSGGPLNLALSCYVGLQYLRSLTIDNLELNGNTLSSINTNGDIDINPNGTGVVNILKILGLADKIQGTNVTSLIIDAKTATPIVIEGVNIIDGVISAVLELFVDNLNFNGNTISSIDSNGDIILDPNGTGIVDAQATLQALKILVDNLSLNDNTISSTDTDGNIILAPDGTGIVDVQATLQALMLLVDNLAIDGNAILSTNSNGNIVLDPNGTGKVIILGELDAQGGLNIVDDTSPQLGGDLDINGQDIISVSNADIDILPDGTGRVNLDGQKTPPSVCLANQMWLENDGTGDLQCGYSPVDPNNLGAGEGIFAHKSGNIHNYKSLKEGTNITITADANEITITAAAGVGEANTASNLGAGEGIYGVKAVYDLRFKSLKVGAGLEIASDANEITISKDSNYGLPVGSIIPWYNANGALPVPDCFQEADGSQINEVRSIINGHYTPNLNNATETYLAGSNTDPNWGAGAPGVVGDVDNSKTLAVANIPQMSDSDTVAGSVDIDHDHPSASGAATSGGSHSHFTVYNGTTSGSTVDTVRSINYAGSHANPDYNYWLYGTVGTPTFSPTSSHGGHTHTVNLPNYNVANRNISWSDNTASITVGTGSPTAIDMKPRTIRVKYIMKICNP